MNIANSIWDKNNEFKDIMESIRKKTQPLVNEQIKWLEQSMIYFDYFKGKSLKDNNDINSIQKEALAKWLKLYNPKPISQDKLLLW